MCVKKIKEELQIELIKVITQLNAESKEKVIAVTASKVKSNSTSSNGAGGVIADNNKMAQEQIADKLEEVTDIEW